MHKLSLVSNRLNQLLAMRFTYYYNKEHFILSASRC